MVHYFVLLNFRLGLDRILAHRVLVLQEFRKIGELFGAYRHKNVLLMSLGFVMSVVLDFGDLLGYVLLIYYSQLVHFSIILPEIFVILECLYVKGFTE